jgi:hypothetical protein
MRLRGMLPARSAGKLGAPTRPVCRTAHNHLPRITPLMRLGWDVAASHLASSCALECDGQSVPTMHKSDKMPRFCVELCTGYAGTCSRRAIEASWDGLQHFAQRREVAGCEWPRAEPAGGGAATVCFTCASSFENGAVELRRNIVSIHRWRRRAGNRIRLGLLPFP